MATKIKWDVYEAVLLIDAYRKIESGEWDRDYAIEKVSSDLRQKAINAGYKIDDVFRNKNGIAMQLGCIQYAFTDGAKGLRNTSKLFYEAVKIYKSDSTKYEYLLSEAKKTIYESDNDNMGIETK